jgi:hypothetical protein
MEASTGKPDNMIGSSKPIIQCQELDKICVLLLLLEYTLLQLIMRILRRFTERKRITTLFFSLPSQRFSVFGLCVGYGADEDLCSPFATLFPLRDLRRLVLGQHSTTSPTLKPRVLACFVGRAVATFRGIRGERRYLLYLQHALGQAVRKRGWNGLAYLSPEAINTFEWWASDEPWQRNGHQMTPERRPLQVSVRSDAATATLGWGGTLQVEGHYPVRTRGNFTESECSLHINALELLGCWYTIHSLLPPSDTSGGLASYTC